MPPLDYQSPKPRRNQKEQRTKIAHLITATLLAVSILEIPIGFAHGGLRLAELFTPRALTSPFILILAFPILLLIIFIVGEAIASLRRISRFRSITALTLSGVFVPNMLADSYQLGMPAIFVTIWLAHLLTTIALLKFRRNQKSDE